MKGTKDIRIQKYASANILANTQNILTLLEKIQSRRDDMEDIHDLRVASRRIRTTLTIFTDFFPKQKGKAWHNTVRSITRKFGKTRDLDVQIEFLEKLLSTIADRRTRAGILRVRLRLTQKRKKIDQKVEKRTDSFLNDKNLFAMQSTLQEIHQTESEEEYPPELYQLAFSTINTALDRFLYFELFLHHPEKIHELHLMRIAAKNLRYTLEVFLPLYHGKMDGYLDTMKTIQQKLGSIHDCDVWIAFLPEFIQSEEKRIRKYYDRLSPVQRLLPGFEFIQQNRQTERNRIYNDFQKKWQQWKSAEIWLNLRELILQATIPCTQTIQNSNTISGGNDTKDVISK